MSINLTRRHVILGSLAAIGAGWLGKHAHISDIALTQSNPISGSILGASSKLGHLLRDKVKMPEPTKTITTGVAIIGGGMAGLSAVWKLNKTTNLNCTILELEKNLGGNSQSGENKISAYPWGAHYVPLPTDESIYVKELFEELGVITGYDAAKKPIYNEFYLCSEPDERLFIYGQWQDGLVPTIGSTDDDKRQYEEFLAEMKKFKNAKGADGKKAFAIPLDFSSHDEKFLQYDKITMAEYMKQKGWTSQKLNWFVNYSCRDDYGTEYTETSAWAGIHYFASRNSEASNTNPDNVVTWPEGNGWLVKKLKSIIKADIKTNSVVYKVSKSSAGVEVLYLDAITQEVTKLIAKSAIMATPHFVAAYLLGEEPSNDVTYAPWMTANITLNKMPAGDGVRLAWDNVPYGSQSLGYVVATHQNLESVINKTVITYYWPLSHLAPADARKEAITRKYEDWQKIILAEMLKIHPELNNQITNIDVWLWGHGMVRPTKDFIWGEARKKLQKQSAPIFFAHSDMSGISIFEEAQYHGVKAAELVKRHLNA